MPSFGDTALIALIALLLFGPKKLPELARQLGKLMGEFRRASNEFRMQMEDELRVSEQADQQKKIAAMEAAAPIAPPLLPSLVQDESIVVDHPHMPAGEPPSDLMENSIAAPPGEATDAAADAAKPERHTEHTEPDRHTGQPVGPLPIATSGDLNMMPPSTGLPASRASQSPLSPVLASIPHTPGPEAELEPASEQNPQEAPLHG